MKNLDKFYPRVLTWGSLVGLLAMTWQATERIHMLKYPDSVLGCDLNPVVDCGSVLGHQLAAVMGPPNAFIGMIVFTMLLMAGYSRLTGAQWSLAQKKLVLALTLILSAFSVWFFAVSMYVIGKLCLFCIFGWLVAVPIGWYSFYDYVSSQKSKKFTEFTTSFKTNHLNFIIGTYGLMIILFILRFWDYYFGQ